MLYKEFDVLIDTIEENVTKSWEEIEDKLKTSLAMTTQQLNGLFKYFYPRNITINRYYKERKAIRAMEEILNSPQETMDNIIDRFGYSDYSVFYKTINKITGKSPQKIAASENCSLPKVLHLEDILKDIDYDINNQIRNRTNLHNYICEKAELVDRIAYARKRIPELRRMLLDHKDPEEREVIMSVMCQIEEELANDRRALSIYQHKPVYIKNLTPGLYAEFIKIEDCRSIYDLSIEQIVNLYNESIESDYSLRFLCDINSDYEYFYEGETELEEEMMREAESEYRENNMNLSEIWQYYYDDDIDDPYAPIEDIEEYDYCEY